MRYTSRDSQRSRIYQTVEHIPMTLRRYTCRFKWNFQPAITEEKLSRRNCWVSIEETLGKYQWIIAKTTSHRFDNLFQRSSAFKVSCDLNLKKIFGFMETCKHARKVNILVCAWSKIVFMFEVCISVCVYIYIFSCGVTIQIDVSKRTRKRGLRSWRSVGKKHSTFGSIDETSTYQKIIWKTMRTEILLTVLSQSSRLSSTLKILVEAWKSHSEIRRDVVPLAGVFATSSCSSSSSSYDDDEDGLTDIRRCSSSSL